MSSRDPFLISIGVFIDRASAWLVLVALHFAFLWAVVLERWLGQSWYDAIADLRGLTTGHVEPIVMVLFGLTLAVSVLSSSLLSVLLFARWRRHGAARLHVRGTRMED